LRKNDGVPDATAMTAYSPSAAGFTVVAVPISAYRSYPALTADDEAEGVGELLAPLGGEAVAWPGPPGERNSSRVNERLSGWASSAGARNSFLLWIGHGETDGLDAWLASYETQQPMQGTGIRPDHLADHITGEWSRRRNAPGTWTLIVIEACGAERFVERLGSAVLERPNPPDRLGLIGVGGKGSSFLGRFRKALKDALNTYTTNDDSVPIHDLVWKLEQFIDPGKVITIGLSKAAPLQRPREFAAQVTAPQDIYLELRSFLQSLPEDQRGHFVAKAQGGEQGELAWYFVGRVEQHRRIATWLSTTDEGLLAVTGPAGGGKSALLGNILVHTTPPLRDLLIRAGQLTRLPSDERPADNVFDAVIHLTGLTPSDTVLRLAHAAGFGTPPAGTEVGDRIEWLLGQLQARITPFTVLADALDESQDPLTVGSAVLRRVSLVPGCRVIVGTRRSTHEGPDTPRPDDSNLLDALSGADRLTTVTVDQDSEAVAVYVTRRLQAARRSWNKDLEIDDDAIQAMAASVGEKRRQFLYARLAVHEILARPRLLTASAHDELTDLLSHDHQALFATAVRRLSEAAPLTDPLLEALALSRGRGVPRADRIWATVAGALADSQRVTETDIDKLLALAAPYIMLDAEDGQSVYRLAHRTFQEYFIARLDGRTPEAAAGQEWSLTPGAAAGATGHDTTILAERHLRIVTALLAQAREIPQGMNAYVRRRLSGHVAEARAWDQLAGATEVLDALDVDALASDVLATSFGRRQLPVEVASTVLSRHLIASVSQADRTTVRQLAQAHQTGWVLGSDSATTSSTLHLKWARRFVRDAMSVPLAGHTGAVTAVAAVCLPDRRVLLATGSDDGTIRLWDPATGVPVGNPLTGLPAVATLAAVPLPDGRVLLATGSGDGTIRLWDPATGVPVGNPLTGWAAVAALAAVPLPDGRVLLATGSKETSRSMRLWDPAADLAYYLTVGSSPIAVTAMTAVSLPDGRVLLAAGSGDSRVWVWDLAPEGPSDPSSWVLAPVIERRAVSSSPLGVTAVTPVPLPDGRVLLAASSSFRVRLWDPATGKAARHRLRRLKLRHRGLVTALAAVPLPDGRVLLGTGSSDGTVRLWDPATGAPVGGPLPGHTRRVTAVAAVPLPDGRVLLATGSSDGTVRLWDPASAPVGDPLTGHTRQVTTVAAVPLPDGRVLLATGSDDGTVRLWESATGEAARQRLRPLNRRLNRPNRAPWVSAVAAVQVPDAPVLLATSYYRTVRLWDPATGKAVRRGLRPLRFRHDSPVTAFAAVPLEDGRVLLATCTGIWNLKVPLWDLATGTPVGDLPAHDTRAVAAVRLPDGRVLLATGSDFDRMVQLWDPATGTPVGDPLTGHTRGVTAVTEVHLPDGRVLLATGSKDDTVRLWDPATGTPVGDPLTGHTRGVTAVTEVHLPDGRVLLATGSEDETVRLWDLPAGRQLHSLPVRDVVQALAVHGNELTVATRAGLLVLSLANVL